MEIHIFKQYHGVRSLCKTSYSFAIILIILFPNKRDKSELNRHNF